MIPGFLLVVDMKVSASLLGCVFLSSRGTHDTTSGSFFFSYVVVVLKVAFRGDVGETAYPAMNPAA
jgi:hypothetical protein